MVRADTFGATSGATTSGTSVPGFEVLKSPNGPNSFSFNGLTGGPGSLSLMLGPFNGAPRRLKTVGGLSSGSHVRKTKTPFLACSGMRPWTDDLSHRCHTCTRIWQYEGSTSVEDHNVPFVDHA